jgi:transposase
MFPKAAEVRLRRGDRAVLEARVRAATSEQRDVMRARIVLLAASGRSTRSIAREVSTMPRTVSLWRGRYAREGLAGLSDKPRPGPPPKYSVETDKRVLAVLDRPLPAGYSVETDKRVLAVLDRPLPAGFARWTGGLIAAELGDVHEQQVWRILREQQIDLDGRKSWCESDDPAFAAKAADVVGLYMAPPEKAIVICVDEKPSIQALERAQGYLKLPGGRTLTGHSHDYKRNGTSTLFAAFEVATGKVTTAHKTRRRRVEFLDFMNDIVAAYPDTALHVVLDNLNIHKPKNDRWLKRHPNVRFHFTPTRASGSTRSRSGSRSWRKSPCTARPSPRSSNSGSTSMLSSTPTTSIQSPSSGQKRKSTRDASKADVSVNCDSGY